MKPDFEEIYKIAKCVRGCASDDQFTDLTDNIESGLRDAYAAGYRDGQERMRAAAESVCGRFDEYALAGQVLDIHIEEPPT